MNKGVIIETPEMKCEKLPYPKEEIEHIVSQIIKVADSNYATHNTTQIHNTLDTLNNMLSMYCKPMMVLKDKRYE